MKTKIYTLVLLLIMTSFVLNAQNHKGDVYFSPISIDFNDGLAEQFELNIVDGMLVMLAENDNGILFSDKGVFENMAIYKDTTFEDYTISVKFTNREWRNVLGIIFNYQNKDNFYYAEVYGKTEGKGYGVGIRIKKDGKYDEGTGTDNAATGYTFPDKFNDAWINSHPWSAYVPLETGFEELKVKNSQGKTTISINGTTLLTDIATGVFLKGKLGLITQWDKCTFDDFKIISNKGFTGIKNVKNSTIYNLYPNPVADQLKLDKQAKKIEVLNFIGVKLLSKNDANSIDLTSLPKGIYFIKINGTEVHKITLK